MEELQQLTHGLVIYHQEEQKLLTIPQISVKTPINTNNVDVSISNPNGNTDQNVANNNMSTTFWYVRRSNGQISIDVTTDNYPSETTWELKENGNHYSNWRSLHSSSGPQPTTYVTITPGNCYTFIMKDSYGDGILTGNFKVKDVNKWNNSLGGTKFSYWELHIRGDNLF